MFMYQDFDALAFLYTLFLRAIFRLEIIQALCEAALCEFSETHYRPVHYLTSKRDVERLMPVYRHTRIFQTNF